MSSSPPAPKLHHHLLLVLSSLLPALSMSDPRAQEAALICSNKTAPPSIRPTFVSSFLTVMDATTPLVTSRGYGAVSNRTGNVTVYAFGECMKDLSPSDCALCFAQCKTHVLSCLPFQRGTTAGRLFFDGCYARYDDHAFFAEAVGEEDRVVCGNASFGGDRRALGRNVAVLARNLTAGAARNDGFAVGSASGGNVTVYGLAQCWEAVNGSGCARCLGAAARGIQSCPPKSEGRGLNAGCYMRYTLHKFYNNSASDATRGGGNRRSAIIAAVISSVLAILLIIGASGYFLKKRILKRKRGRKQLGALLKTVNKSKLNFSYETLERATNYFHSSNKLGQGGSGSVYKGVLPDGSTVAIKRLFFNSMQWADHFFNEVNLINGIRHKNLVGMLGCSITGPESLLVYEYVSNQSLHDHLLGKRSKQTLSWEARYKIIMGTAEGLVHLHEESNPRIIHRDIKLSNVLLDEDFTAKIADFGLARLFPEDKTHISTALAGTLGYLAPEYVVCGRLSEKADVYSFGILVIEVVSGQKNNCLSQDSSSILQMVWNHYGHGRVCEAVDPAMEGMFEEREASRLLQIGLVCSQASADLRPSMSVVVGMLTGNHGIPAPTQPPFLNPNPNGNISGAMQAQNRSSWTDSNSQSSGNDASMSSSVRPR